MTDIWGRSPPLAARLLSLRGESQIDIQMKKYLGATCWVGAERRSAEGSYWQLPLNYARSS